MKLKGRSQKFFNVLAIAALCTAANLFAFAQVKDRVRVITKKATVKTPTPTPTPTPQTLANLRSRIGIILSNPLLRRGRMGLKIVSLDSGEAVFEKNVDKYFMPASNMKNFTVAAALENLSPDFQFVTSIYANSKPDSNGTIKGDLTVYGRGDPSISTGFSGGDYYRGIDVLVDKIVQAGVKMINGNIVGDETYFNSKPIPYGWEWEDLQWYYGAEISSLTINDNSVDLTILPGSVGAACTVSVSPENSQYRIINRMKTTAAGTKREFRVTKRIGQNIVEVSGNMPADDRGFRGAITVSRPAKLFVELIKQRLEKKGVKVKGTFRAINLEERNGQKLQVENLIEIASLKSPPLSLIAAKTMKLSQNLYTELILRVLGEEMGDKSDGKKTSERRGIEIVRDLLLKAGAPPDSIVQYDASGLSRHNLVTPNSVVSLYRYMDKSRYAAHWRSSLTVGGVDGTLKRRFVGTSAEANAQGKTGTFDQVSALSGYVRSKSGERFVFSILANNIPNKRLRISTIDRIVVLLSDFDGETKKN